MRGIRISVSNGATLYLEEEGLRTFLNALRLIPPTVKAITREREPDPRFRNSTVMVWAGRPRDGCA